MLLVEDSAPMRFLYAAMLEGLGYRAHAAADATTALEMFRHEADIEVILSDFDLGPGRNGIELIERLQAIRHVPAALLTGTPERVDRRLRGVRVHRKPLQTEALADVMEALISTLD